MEEIRRGRRKQKYEVMKLDGKKTIIGEKEQYQVLFSFGIILFLVSIVTMYSLSPPSSSNPSEPFSYFNTFLYVVVYGVLVLFILFLVRMDDNLLNKYHSILPIGIFCMVFFGVGITILGVRIIDSIKYFNLAQFFVTLSIELILLIWMRIDKNKISRNSKYSV